MGGRVLLVGYTKQPAPVSESELMLINMALPRCGGGGLVIEQEHVHTTITTPSAQLLS